MSVAVRAIGSRKRQQQCNVELPAAVASALDAHLAVTGVQKRDFVSLAIRREIWLQRSKGLGLVNGQVPAEGRAMEGLDG